LHIWNDCNVHNKSFIDIGHSYGSPWDFYGPHPLGNFSSMSDGTLRIRVHEIEVFEVKESHCTLRALSIPNLNPLHQLAESVSESVSDQSDDSSEDHVDSDSESLSSSGVLLRNFQTLGARLKQKLTKEYERLDGATSLLEIAFLREAQSVHQIVCSYTAQKGNAAEQCVSSCKGNTRISSWLLPMDMHWPPQYIKIKNSSINLERIEEVLKQIERLTLNRSSAVPNSLDLVNFNVMGKTTSIRRSSIQMAAPECTLSTRVTKFTEQVKDLHSDGSIPIDEPIECFGALLGYLRLRSLRLELGLEVPVACDRLYVSNRLVESMSRLLDYHGIVVPIVAQDPDTKLFQLFKCSFVAMSWSDKQERKRKIPDQNVKLAAKKPAVIDSGS
jgi:hypothetical protein